MYTNKDQSSSFSFQKKKPILDIAAPRRSAPLRSSSLRVEREAVSQRVLLHKKSLDGIRNDQRSFAKLLREQSVFDSARRCVRKSELAFRQTKRLVKRVLPDIAPRKMLYGSLVGGVAFGMVSMAFIEHSFGPGVFARSVNPTPIVSEQHPETVADAIPDLSDSGNDIFFEYFDEAKEAEYQKNIRDMVKGYPIEEMLPYIFEQDHVVSAFLVGIAKKESNWGKRVPVLEGQDCFNYWGYRGVRRMMGTGGHTCFNSRKDAVETVAKRLTTLIHSQKLNTPEKLIVWKCGFSCQGHSRESVKKWIADVDMYFEQANDE